MKRALILTFVAMLALTMASCDWDPTGVGTGTGGDGDDKKEREDKGDDKKERDDVMVVRGMEGDAFKTPCSFHFTVQSILVSEKTDAVTDRKTDRAILVIIEVTNADGTTTSHTLTPESPSVTIGDCTIHLKEVSPMKTSASDRVSYVATFAVTTGK